MGVKKSLRTLPPAGSSVEPNLVEVAVTLYLRLATVMVNKPVNVVYKYCNLYISHCYDSNLA